MGHKFFFLRANPSYTNALVRPWSGTVRSDSQCYRLNLYLSNNDEDISWILDKFIIRFKRYRCESVFKLKVILINVGSPFNADFLSFSRLFYNFSCLFYNFLVYFTIFLLILQFFLFILQFFLFILQFFWWTILQYYSLRACLYNWTNILVYVKF